ncbi:transporter substrate-binding domain-containing protein [Rhodoblastus sp.]|uniref:transporter substrate-binding domain-containing protein n=1 Tax=Rhodoblastus sp. TaxID=1962975 RepID=UPI003F99BB95
MPSLFDSHNRLDAPAAGAVKQIRFLTADDYPPFEFMGPDGTLAGFNVDLARAICDELQASCTIQPRRWDNLLDAMKSKDGDALIASLKETPAAQARLRFTAAYYLTPARFMSLAGAKNVDVRPEALRNMTVGVVAGSAHEAFLKRFFAPVTMKSFPDRAALFAALRGKKIDLAFGDAVTFAIWMNDPRSRACCVFQGGPFLEPDFFGQGVGIGVRPEDETLRAALNWALQQLDDNGKLNELYLKYFPIGFY